MKRYNKVFMPFVFILLAVFLAKNLYAEIEVSKPCKEEVVQKSVVSGQVQDTSEIMQKIQTLRMPFIVNVGQVDEQVAFYAKTFGGTVFVTKDGEIVYSLPSGRDVPAGASQESGRGGEQGGKVVLGWHGQAMLGRAESEFTANGYASFLRPDNAHCPPERVLANTLLAIHLPGLQESADNFVGTRRPCPPQLAYLSGLQKGTDKQNLPMPSTAIQNPQFTIKGVALKEQLVGGKINEVRGGAQSVTTVSYFKGNDPSKWKSSLSTYEVVDLGEVYEGIGLSLKAYGDNV